MASPAAVERGAVMKGGDKGGEEEAIESLCVKEEAKIQDFSFVSGSSFSERILTLVSLPTAAVTARLPSPPNHPPHHDTPSSTSTAPTPWLSQKPSLPHHLLMA